MWEEPGGVLDDLARHAKALGQLLDVRVALAEVGQRVLPRTSPPWCRRLREVPENCGGPRRATPADRTQHHLRKVLRLVGHDMTHARRTVDQVRGLVDEYGVSQGPSCGSLALRRLLPYQDGLLLLREDAISGGGEKLSIAQQAQHEFRRADPGPELVDVLLHRTAARDGVLYPVVGGVAGKLHLHQDRVRQLLRKHRARSRPVKQY